MTMPDINGFATSDERNLTCDGFPTEKLAQDWFASFARKTKCFAVYEQVRGSRIYRHYQQDNQDSFIADTILLPIDGRISIGAIVVEVKRSGETIGPGISQLRDYLQSVFPVANRIGIVPAYGFLFPCHKQNKSTASWMQHQRLGSIHVNNFRNTVIFYSGEERLLEFSIEGELLHSVEPKSGKKSGSR